MEACLRKLGSLKQRRKRPLAQVGGVDERTLTGAKDQAVLLPVIPGLVYLYKLPFQMAP